VNWFNSFSERIISFLLLTIWLGNPVGRLSNMNWQTFCDLGTNCSDRAIQFVIDQKYPQDQIMTLYNWGGYLIWRYPNLKPSIDGRMHVWRNEKGYSAFSYYYPFEQNLKDIDKSRYNYVLTSTDKPMFLRLIELAKF